jgi:hypothetical protein
MRAIHIASLDKPRPVVVLTRDVARPVLTNVTVAPISTRIRGLAVEVRVGVRNGQAPGSGQHARDSGRTAPDNLRGKSRGSGRQNQSARSIPVRRSCRNPASLFLLKPRPLAPLRISSGYTEWHLPMNPEAFLRWDKVVMGAVDGTCWRELGALCGAKSQWTNGTDSSISAVGP